MSEVAVNQQKILVISKQDLLIDVISVFLEGWFHSNIEVADTSRKIEQLFSDGTPKGIDLLLVEDGALLTSSGKTVADFMAPTIIIGRSPTQKELSGRRIEYLKRPVDLDQLEKLIRNFAEASGRPKREYCAVRLSILLLSGQLVKQDVYRQMKDGTYEIFIRKGEELRLDGSLRAALGKNESLYLKVEDMSAFMRGFAQELQSISSNDKIFDVGRSMQVSTGVHEMLSEALPELGLTPELQQAAKASIDLAVNSIKKDARLAEILETLSKNETSYLSWHSVALCYVACRLSSLMTWDSTNTHYKLSLAAFFHDMSVKTPALERVKTLDELTHTVADAAEKQAYLEHPHAAAALAREMNDFPGDVDQVIAQHHELPNGKGFPLGITHTRISPLAAVFIVAHELTDDLFDHKDKFNLKETVERLERVYTQGYFRRVVATLKQMSQK